MRFQRPTCREWDEINRKPHALGPANREARGRLTRSRPWTHFLIVRFFGRDHAPLHRAIPHART